MEDQQEEKMREIQRRFRTITLSKSTSSSFPLDLTLEILLRLPAKSVLRFRCVSKLWSSITTDPYFIKSFETRSLTRQSVLVCFRKGNKLCYSSVPYSNEYDTSFNPITDQCHMKLRNDCYFYPTESVHGLVCVVSEETLIIWNPTMRKCLSLLKPENSWKNIIFLGYDPTEGEHKVACMRCDKDGTCDSYWVLTLGSAKKEWRMIKTNHKHYLFHLSFGRCIEGFIYYKSHTDHHQQVIMRFDVRSEKLDMIKLPADKKIPKNVLMINYEGRLACVEDNPMKKDGITLLILEDAEKHEWLSKDFLAPFHYSDPSSMITSQLKGMTPAGEFVYVPDELVYFSYVSFYDPEKNSFRKVEFEGTMNDEFRLSNGLLNTIYALRTSLNHIESLISL